MTSNIFGWDAQYPSFSVGFSISIMKSDATILRCLDASTKAPCWPAGSNGNKFVLDSKLIYHGSDFLHFRVISVALSFVNPFT